MKSEFEVYMETGILGGYIPERAIGYRDDNTITPIYRDTSYHETERGMELRREMIVGGRKFLCPFHLLYSRESENTYGADAPNHRQ